MRRQYPIYNQAQISALRNIAFPNVNTSTDLCIYTEPSFYVSGATKVPFSIESCIFSSITETIDNTFIALSGTCYSAISLSTCFSSMTWSNEVYINSGLTTNNLIYSGDMVTDITTATTLTKNIYELSVLNSINSLGWSYSTDPVGTGTSVSISKPYGVNQIDFDLCVDTIYDSGCTSGTCGICTTICSYSYPYMTSASTGVYFFGSTNGSIDFPIVFTGNMSSFDVSSSSDTIFKCSIYKYDINSGGFKKPAVYTSDEVAYSAISATSSVTITVSSTTLGLDGDYLIKGNFIHNACTDILRKLGVRNDTSLYQNGTMYSLYNEDVDYYFVAITSAATPLLMGNTPQYPSGNLFGFSIFPTYDGQTALTYSIEFSDSPIVALNGLVQANNYDYSISGQVVSFTGGLFTTDVVTLIGTIGATSFPMHTDLIIVNNPIVSGVTDGQGSESVYYNTTTSMFEVYTSLTPMSNDNVVITLNGVVLAPNIDYYQSISNPKRFILIGTLVVSDVINLYYRASTSLIDSIYSNSITIAWDVPLTPQAVNGVFTAELSTGNTFTDIMSSATTDYVIGVASYNVNLTLSGSVGTTLYYRVKNNKNYQNLTGDIIASEAYSEIIPITIASNAINSY